MIFGADHGEESGITETDIHGVIFAFVEKSVSEPLSAEFRKQHGFAEIENVPGVESGSFDGFAEFGVGFGERNSGGGSDDFRAMVRDYDQAVFRRKVSLQIIHFVIQRAIVEIRKFPENRDAQARDLVQEWPRRFARVGCDPDVIHIRCEKCLMFPLCKSRFEANMCPMMISPFHKLFLFLALALPHPAFAQEKPADEAKKAAPTEEAAKKPEPVSIQSKVTIDGQVIPYTATTGKLILRDEKGKAKASVFHITYKRDGIKDTKDRPVMFAFNGGPGSSSVWLHLGILGPKRIDFPGDGTQPLEPPARLIDNDMSLLDVCDLVFIDPVSTGYSRAEKDGNPKDFHGLQQDIDSVGDFIRIWITENKRWASPKYLCGESYGGVRAAGLAHHLQERYGMSLNGVVLLSSLLDYRTLIGSQGSHLNYQVFLPTFATTAHFHKKIEGDREAILREARKFAFGDYGLVLMKGNEISEEEKGAVAAKLSKLTGIPAETWIRNSLRLDAFEFRKELLREEGKVIGRFDARVAWPTTNPNSTSAEYDPSYSLAIGAFSTAMLSYLGNDLGWKEDQPYEVLTGKVHPWTYGSDNRIVNLTSRLTTAMRDNPKLRVLVMGAHADLATPPEGVPYSLRQEVNLPEDLRGQFTFTYYDAGHMFYINPSDLVKSRADLVEFLKR